MKTKIINEKVVRAMARKYGKVATPTFIRDVDKLVTYQLTQVLKNQKNDKNAFAELGRIALVGVLF